MAQQRGRAGYARGGERRASSVASAQNIIMGDDEIIFHIARRMAVGGNICASIIELADPNHRVFIGHAIGSLAINDGGIITAFLNAPVGA